MLVLHVQGGPGNGGDKVEKVNRGKAGLVERKMQLSCGYSSQPHLPAEESGRRNDC